MDIKLLTKALKKGVLMSLEAYVALELALTIKIISLQAYEQSHFLLGFMKLSGVLLITIILVCLTYSVLSAIYKRKRLRTYYRVKFL